VTSALDEVVGLVGVVSDLLGDELLLDDARCAAALHLELVDVAAGNDGVTGTELGVGLSAVLSKATISWKVGTSLVKLPSTSLRHCSTPTRRRQHSSPFLVK
jgi:hypothetical protein